MSGETIGWIWMGCFVVCVGALMFILGALQDQHRLRARHCQFCCNVIGRWRAFFGVVNCEACVYRMRFGGSPRCSRPGPHEHDREVEQ